jgi:hypothetical protein
MSDKTINCCDCHNDFTFTEGEQVYYKDRNLAEPKRCPNCRLKRRGTLGKNSVTIDESKKEK